MNFYCGNSRERLLEAIKYTHFACYELKQSLVDGKQIKGARVFLRNVLDMIELYDPDVDTFGYVSTNIMTDKVIIKLSSETNL